MWALACSLDSALCFNSIQILYKCATIQKVTATFTEKYYAQTLPSGTEMAKKPPIPADWDSGPVPDIIFRGNNPFPMAA